MIASQNQRERAFFERGQRRFVQLLADARDLADVLLARIARRFDFGNWRQKIAGVGNVGTERRKTFAEAGDAKRRGSHVDAAPIAAEIERDADDVHGAHGANCTMHGACNVVVFHART